MKGVLESGTVVLLGLVYCGSLAVQSAASVDLQTPPPPASSEVVSVPAGEGLVLELNDPLSTQTSRKGDQVKLTTTSEVLVGGQVAIPRGSTVRATVTRSKRPGRLFGKAQIQLDFNQVTLPDGTTLPLSAKLSRAGWWGSSGKIQPVMKGEQGKGHDVFVLGQGAAQGAIIGGIYGGRRGALRGAAAGAALSLLAVMLERGPELDLPPGMMFEIELLKPVGIPVAAIQGWQWGGNLAASSPLPEAGNAETPDAGAAPEASLAQPPQVSASSEPSASPAESSTVAANRTPPPARVSVPPAALPAPAPREPAPFTVKVDVNLVLVEATVRDQRGGIVDGLRRNDFRLLEDGVEQEIQHFSRDELPLAVALLVDRSGSVAPILDGLRRAAYETLSQLKPDDEVALFTFAGKSQRLEYLTTDRRRIADRIATIEAGGGTNITDALFDAALYLGRAAPRRRHAIILVSDNQPTVRGYAGEGQVIRTALETETVIYSIQVGGGARAGVLKIPIWVAGAGSVKKITRETGGEILDIRRVGSVESAMAAVLSRLKQRYTLGYQSTNKRRDGSFRKIDVRLTDAVRSEGGKYRVYARRGYYAPMERAAATANTP